MVSNPADSKCCLNSLLDTSLALACGETVETAVTVTAGTTPTGSKRCLNFEPTEQQFLDGVKTSTERAREINAILAGDGDQGSVFRYRHRHCTGQNVDDCGVLSDLSEFKVCPLWLQWEEWGKCEYYETVLTPERSIDPPPSVSNDGVPKDDSLGYKTYRRTRTRPCNMDEDSCLNVPGANLEISQYQPCGKIIFQTKCDR